MRRYGYHAVKEEEATWPRRLASFERTPTQNTWIFKFAYFEMIRRIDKSSISESFIRQPLSFVVVLESQSKVETLRGGRRT